MKCRCCGEEMPKEPLLAYRDMPKSAQFFPDAGNVAEEKGVDLLLCQCPFCGLLQLAGEPVPYYREVIRATRVSPEMHGFRVKQFRDFLHRYDLLGKRIVEIGCGGGEFLQMMQEAGATVYGIEYSAALAAQARSEGHTVHQLYLEAGAERIPEVPYDAFYCLSFLEHSPEPGAFLRRIAGNLTSGAHGLVEVPDVDMVLRENLYSEFIQDHLSYFTKDTFCRLLEQNGFEVLSCGTIWHGYVLSAEVRKRRIVDVSGFLAQQEKVKKSVAAFLTEMEEKGRKTAVWGAGHQALADLAMLDMKERIVCVLDSADFKQNKFTPATHIPIAAPAELKKGEIGAVLVIAGSYSNEICRILETEHPEIVRAVLQEDGVERA